MKKHDRKKVAHGSKIQREKVILVGCQTTEDDLPFHYSMDELASLTKTANGEVLTTLTQKRERASIIQPILVKEK